MSDDSCSWATAVDKESYWTREFNGSKPSCLKKKEKALAEAKETLRAINKRLKVVFEDEGVEYGPDADTEDELASRFATATSLRDNRIKEIFELIEQANFVQLCFVIDATGSMGPYITGVMECIQSIADDLLLNKNEDERIKELQIGIIAYRDYDDSPQFEKLAFTKSLETFKKFCSNIDAKGGGDACEDVLGGLNNALKLDWNPRTGTKLICHMGDAPGHGRELHNQTARSYDSYLDGDPKGHKYQEIFKELLDKDIEYHFGKITNHTDLMIEKFSQAYGEKIHEFNVKDWKMIRNFVVTSVEISVGSTVSKSTIASAPRRGIRAHTLDPIEPDWLKLPKREGKFTSYSYPESIQAIIDDIPLVRNEPKKAIVQIAENPFAKGSERLAFYGMDVSTYVVHKDKSSKHKSEKSMDIKRKNEQIVVKEYLHVGQGMNSARRYELNNQLQTIASYLASEFSKELKIKIGGDREIKFLKIRTLQVSSDKGKRYMSCERRYHSGDKFVRFTNNTCYKILESKVQELGIPAETIDVLMAFSHWTYQTTEEYLMIVDLQGIISSVKDGQKQVLLTDPAIHCRDRTRFTPMNHGIGGMANFFKRHTCNTFCKSLGLKEPLLLT